MRYSKDKFRDTPKISRYFETLKFQLAGFAVASCEGNWAFADIVMHAVDTAPIVQARQALAVIDFGRTVLARVSLGAFAPGSHIEHRITHFVKLSRITYL